MNADRFARCIGEVDETLVEQALTYTPPHRRWKPFAALAACLLAVLTLHLAGVFQPAAQTPASLSLETPQQTQTDTETQTQPDTAEDAPQSQPQKETGAPVGGTSDGQAPSPAAAPRGSAASGTNHQKTGQVRPQEKTDSTARPQTTTRPAAALDTTSKPAAPNEDQSVTVAAAVGGAGADKADKGFLPYEGNGSNGSEIGITFSWEKRAYTITETLSSKPDDLGEALGVLTTGDDGAFVTENPHLDGGTVYQSPEEAETLVVELNQQYALFREAQE